MLSRLRTKEVGVHCVHDPLERKEEKQERELQPDHPYDKHTKKSRKRTFYAKQASLQGMREG